MNTFNRVKSVGFYINYLGRQTRKYLESEAEKLELKTGDLFILKHVIQDEGISQNQISSKMKMNKAHIARSTSHLIQKNYIIVKSDKKNSRINKLFLTEKGKKLIPTLQIIFRNWSSVLTSDFSEQEKFLILELLKRMSENTKNYHRGNNE